VMSAETEAMQSLPLGSVRDAREALGHRAVSSRELVELLLHRIDAIDSSVNAVVELRAEEALEEAKGADRAIAAGGAGPLLGVPVTIKEAFNVAGLHTTWGNPEFKDYLADWDATRSRRPPVPRTRPTRGPFRPHGRAPCATSASGLSCPMFRARLAMS